MSMLLCDALKKVCVIFFLLFSLHVPAQDFFFKGEIRNYVNDKAYLYQVYGDEIVFIDTLRIDKNGKFFYKIDNSFKIGVYKIKLFYNQITQSEEYIDFIFNHENINFSTSYRALALDVEIIESDENKIYYLYNKTLYYNSKKIEFLNLLRTLYSDTSKFSNAIDQEKKIIPVEQEQFVSNIIKKHPSSYAVKLIKAFQSIAAPAGYSEIQQLNFYKEHFLDPTDFSDSTLVYSAVFPYKVAEYFTYYSDKKLSAEEQQKQYCKAVDVIMRKASDNKEVREFVINGLARTFLSKKYDILYEYLIVNYASSERCENEQGDNRYDYLSILERIKNTRTGTKSPNIELISLSGEKKNLHDLNSSVKLLVYWSYSCSHCNELLKRLNEDKKSIISNKIKIIPISVNKNKEELTTFIKEKKYPWKIYCDYKGWESLMVKTYNVNATPTMYLLDKNDIIIGKAYTYDQLVKILQAVKAN